MQMNESMGNTAEHSGQDWDASGEADRIAREAKSQKCVV